MPSKIRILNVDIDNISLEVLLAELREGFIVTPNVDHMIKLQQDLEFYKIYRSADYVVCDSQILLYASHLLRTPIKEKICGSDLFPAFIRYHRNNPEMRIFLLGGMPGSAEKVAKDINLSYERQIVTGHYCPPFGFENDPVENHRIIKLINDSGANVLAVGVGAPKQEKWIANNRDMLPGIDIFFAIGATFEFESGNIQRAPVWMRDAGLEWFYRLIKEPARLWRRYLVDDMPFFRLLFMQILGKYKNPFQYFERKSYRKIRKSKEILTQLEVKVSA